MSLNKEEKTKTRPCQKEACAIQFCLQREKYDQDRCQSYIEAYEQCLIKYGQKQQTKNNTHQ